MAADDYLRVAIRAEENASDERRRANRWINVAGVLLVLLVLAIAAAVVPRALAAPSAARAVRLYEARYFGVPLADVRGSCGPRGICTVRVCAVWAVVRVGHGRWAGNALWARFRDGVARRGGRWVVRPGPHYWDSVTGHACHLRGGR